MAIEVFLRDVEWFWELIRVTIHDRIDSKIPKIINIQETLTELNKMRNLSKLIRRQ